MGTLGCDIRFHPLAGPQEKVPGWLLRAWKQQWFKPSEVEKPELLGQVVEARIKRLKEEGL